MDPYLFCCSTNNHSQQTKTTFEMNEVDVEAPNGERSPFDLSNSVHGDETSMESDEELSDYEEDDDDEPTINTEAARKKFKNMKQTGSNTVYAVLALAAIGFSLATFFLLKSANEKKFKSEVRTNGVASKPNDKKDIFAKMPVYSLKLWLGFFLLFFKFRSFYSFKVMLERLRILQKIMRIKYLGSFKVLQQPLLLLRFRQTIMVSRM